MRGTDSSKHPILLCIFIMLASEMIIKHVPKSENNTCFASSLEQMLLNKDQAPLEEMMFPPAVMKGLIGREVKCLSQHHWLKWPLEEEMWQRLKLVRGKKKIHTRTPIECRGFPVVLVSVFLNGLHPGWLWGSPGQLIKTLRRNEDVVHAHIHTQSRTHAQPQQIPRFYSQVPNTWARGDSSLPRTTQTHTNKPVYTSKNAQKAHSCLHTPLERQMDTHLNLLLEFPFWKHLLCFSLFSAFLIRIAGNLSVLLGGIEQMDSTKSLWAVVMQRLATEDQWVAQRCLLPVK